MLGSKLFKIEIFTFEVKSLSVFTTAPLVPITTKTSQS